MSLSSGSSPLELIKSTIKSTILDRNYLKHFKNEIEIIILDQIRWHYVNKQIPYLVPLELPKRKVHMIHNLWVIS